MIGFPDYRDRDKEIERHRDRQAGDIQRLRQMNKERDRQTKRGRGTERDLGARKAWDIPCSIKCSTREIESQRDRETEKQKDRGKQRQRDRETET